MAVKAEDLNLAQLGVQPQVVDLLVWLLQIQKSYCLDDDE